VWCWPATRKQLGCTRKYVIGRNGKPKGRSKQIYQIHCFVRLANRRMSLSAIGASVLCCQGQQIRGQQRRRLSCPFMSCGVGAAGQLPSGEADCKTEEQDQSRRMVLSFWERRTTTTGSGSTRDPWGSRILEVVDANSPCLAPA
jgi:hypothetical protein